MRIILIFFTIAVSQMIICADCSQAQFYQEADYGDISVTRKNQLGGYDYYDENGKMVGYSAKNRWGEYVYYDSEGNLLGHLEHRGNSYTFFNADEIPTGRMQKMPTGEYRYVDSLEGGLRSITPPPGEDIGFFPPSSFKKGTLSPELKGGFKKKE